jgi:hypothetical protein
MTLGSTIGYNQTFPVPQVLKMKHLTNLPSPNMIKTSFFKAFEDPYN